MTKHGGNKNSERVTVYVFLHGKLAFHF